MLVHEMQTKTMFLQAFLKNCFDREEKVGRAHFWLCMEGLGACPNIAKCSEVTLGDFSTHDRGLDA